MTGYSFTYYSMAWRRLVYHPEVNYALRQTCVICLPAALGLLTGFLKTGLLFSLVPLCCNIGGLDTPHKNFFKRLIIAALLFAATSYFIQVGLTKHVALPYIMLALTFILGITNEIDPLTARLFPAALLASIFTLGMTSSLLIWQAPVIFIVGTLWYGSFIWAWFRLSKEQPIRESLSQLYMQLADYCEIKYTLLAENITSEALLAKLLSKQQSTMDLINQLYQQVLMLPTNVDNQHKKLIKIFEVAVDLQEHIAVSLFQPQEMQELTRQSSAELIITRNARVIAKRLRSLAEVILYHQRPEFFNMDKELLALHKVVERHPDSIVGQFYYYHFSRIAHLLKTQSPLSKNRFIKQHPTLPVWAILRNYVSLKSPGLRTTARTAITLSVGSLIGLLFNLPKPYWILLTIMSVTQNGYNATRIRSQHRAIGTLIGLIIATGILHFDLSSNVILVMMLILTFFSYLVTRTNYWLSMIGLTITAVYLIQLLTVHASQFILPRFIDTLIGCTLAFASMIWLWPQWQSGLLRRYAHQALGLVEQHLHLLLGNTAINTTVIAESRIKVNQAQNALYNTLNQALQEPSFDSKYLTDTRLWITHSQFIVEHLNAITILVKERHFLPQPKSTEYLTSCEMILQKCQQRLNHELSINDNPSTVDAIQSLVSRPTNNLMEMHLQRIISHLHSMNMISTLAWRQNLKELTQKRN